jgi:hypothetical protein
MALSVSFLLMEASSAADTSSEKRITKLFLTSGQVDPQISRAFAEMAAHPGALHTVSLALYPSAD